MNKNDLKDILKETGFPLEIKVRKQLHDFGLTVYQSKYNTDRTGNDISKDLDIEAHFGVNVLHSRDIDMNVLLTVRVIGEVKKWATKNICIFEKENFNNENFILRLPNFLNDGFTFQHYLGGVISAKRFFELAGKISVSENIAIVDENSNKDTKKGNMKKVMDEGNNIVYDESVDIAFACEYVHRRELNNYKGIDNMFPIHACFPLLVTDAKIMKVSMDEGFEIKDLDDVDNFIYLSPQPYANKLSLTTKRNPILPIVVTTFNGLSKSIDLIKKMKELIDDDVTFISNNPTSITREHTNYKTLTKGENKWHP
ncbi:hypothetical protein AUJ13_02345 [Candidatus Micrarchaeota archaeon CG1_02_49_24]|nr:MAG: hypothetical protein AUJ13_02345 [Candidatus Micrarchaeota archaeon CG1_02_49_24]